MKNSAFESDNKGCRRLGNHFARFVGPFHSFLVSLQSLSPFCQHEVTGGAQAAFWAVPVACFSTMKNEYVYLYYP